MTSGATLYARFIRPFKIVRIGKAWRMRINLLLWAIECWGGEDYNPPEKYTVVEYGWIWRV